MSKIIAVGFYCQQAVASASGFGKSVAFRDFADFTGVHVAGNDHLTAKGFCDNVGRQHGDYGQKLLRLVLTDISENGKADFLTALIERHRLLFQFIKERFHGVRHR